MAVVTVGLSKVSEQFSQKCIACKGTALKSNEPCPWCDGRGKVYWKRLRAAALVMVVSP